MNSIIVYGTTFRATKETSEEIARIIREQKFNVRVINAKEKKNQRHLSRIVLISRILMQENLSNNVKQREKKSIRRTRRTRREIRI